MYADYYNYSVVLESEMTPSESDVSIIKVVEDKLNYLRFRMCLMSGVGGRNRNGRKWTKPILDPMLRAQHVGELLRHGGIPGESGHPVPDVGQASLDRICTIDPERTCMLVKSFNWEGGDKIYGICETLDDGEGNPGRKLMKNMLQGIDPAASIRTIVPQRKNQDGTIDVLGPGRFVCWDRVYVPSCPEAYIDTSIPVKSIVSENKFQSVMESFTEMVMKNSEAFKYVTDTLQPAMESAVMGSDGILMVNTEKEGKILVPVEKKFRDELRNSILKL